MIETNPLLPASEAIFTAVFEFATIGICLLREDGRIVLANPCIEKWFGYSKAELVGQPIHLLLPDMISPREYGAADPDQTQGPLSVAGTKTRATPKAGCPFPVEVRLEHCQLSRPNLLLAFITDITDKTLTDDKFKVIFYKSPAAKTLSDLETGKIIDTNDSFCRFSGYSREELIGKTLIELGMVDARKRKEAIDRVQKNGRLINDEIEIVTKCSQRVFALVSTEQIAIANQQMLLSTFLDITERKKANEALLRANSILENEAAESIRLIQTGNHLWKIDNLNNGLTEVLTASIELTKADKGDIQLYDAEKQVLAMQVSQGLSPAFLEHFREVDADRSCTCGMALQRQAQMVTEDTEAEWNAADAAIARRERFRSVQSTPLLYRDGSPMGMISTHFKQAGTPSASALNKMKLYALMAENFLERLKMYEALQQHNLELEKKVADRTQELRIALKHEKDLNALKSRLVAMASHEFRTPLTTILSSISLVKSYYLDIHQEKRNKHIARVETAVTSLMDILNDFLSLDKLEHGKMEVSPQGFNLYQFSVDTLDELHGLLKHGQQIKLTYNGQKEVVQDPKILKIVLRNLLSNAIKYSEEGKTITLSIAVFDSGVSLRVKDEGIGIAESEQKQVFSTFFRAKNASSIPGTGLGLSIVKKYLELLQGTISFTSQLHSGTTFTITFPQYGR